MVVSSRDCFCTSFGGVYTPVPLPLNSRCHLLLAEHTLGKIHESRRVFEWGVQEAEKKKTRENRKNERENQRKIKLKLRPCL